MPMRSGYADKVYIVTSGENMSIYAAGNIAMAVKNFQNRNYARLGGFILNSRNVKDEAQKVQTLAQDFDSAVVGTLERSTLVQEAEELNRALLSVYPQSDMAQSYRALAEKILKD
jgi:nitrogenase iron protein NifH